MTFLEMLLISGRAFGGARLLRPETLTLMAQNHTGSIPAGVMKAAMPALTNNVDFFPGAAIRWGSATCSTPRPGRTAAAPAP
jgi:hypothetical protein